VSLRITLAHRAGVLINSFIIILAIFFFELSARPKANVNPAIITGVRNPFTNLSLGSTSRFKINFYIVINCPYPEGWFANGIELTFHSPFVDGWRPAMLTEEALDLFSG
jgi:hypothetical protein